MLFGRPVNQWNGLIGSLIGAAGTIIGVTQSAVVAQQWIVILGAVGLVLGAIVAFLAGQPPTLNPGDIFKIATPSGQPNTTGVVTPPDPVTVDSSQPAQDVTLDGGGK